MDNNHDQKILQEIAKLIHSDTSPVGIDAKKTHVLIIKMLDDINRRMDRLEKNIEKLSNE